MSVPAGWSTRSHFGLPEVLRSEWTKLRSVRSTTWGLVLTAALTIGIGVLATSVEVARWHDLSLIDRLTFDPVRLSLTGVLLGQLAVGVLGVLAVTAEYSTGTIRATLVANPRRQLVLVAKLMVFGAVALVVSEAVSFIAFLVGQAILAGTTPHATLAQTPALRAVVESGLYLTALGLLGLGLGFVVRHTAGAISVFVGVLLILPLIVQALPESIADAIGKYLPAAIGIGMVTTHPRPTQHLLGPWSGFGLLCLYVLAIVVAGGIVLARRDA